MIRVLYAGDCALVSTTFLKGMNTFSYGEIFEEPEFLIDALKDDAEIKIDYLRTPNVSRDFPKTIEEISKYDVILVSDIGTDTILLYPNRFKIPMGENRLSLIEQFVKNGGGFALIGGWMAFGGQMGQGKYHGTVIENMLNVDISPFDDRVEVPEGLKFDKVKSGHVLTDRMEWEEAPLLFLGYNRFQAKDREEVLTEYKGDPMMVAHSYGKGRTLAFASDIAPHWGQGFVNWENYGTFWSKSLRWLAGKI